MKTLIPAIIEKLKADVTLTPLFSDRIYALWNPSDPNLLTTVGKFPFIGIVPGTINRVHTDAGQMVDEALQVRVWIYHELYSSETDMIQDLLLLQNVVMLTLEYDNNFIGTSYSGSQIFEVFCTQLGEPEPFNTPEHPMAARISLLFEYARVIEEVLV